VIAQWLSVRLSIGRLGDLIQGHGVNRHSPPWARAFITTAPKKRISGVGLREIAVTKIIKNKFLVASHAVL